MSNPFGWFDHAYVLSDPRTGRLFDTMGHLHDHGIMATSSHVRHDSALRMNNMRRNPGVEFAVNLGHIKNIVHAIACDWDRPLFLEDDVRLKPSGKDVLTIALEQLPENWSVLYLGGSPRNECKRVASHLVRVNQMSMAEAYAINGRYLLAFFEFWCDRVSKPNAMFDFILGEFAEFTDCGYCVFPVITWQPDGYSYIGEKQDSKEMIIKRGWRENLE